MPGELSPPPKPQTEKIRPEITRLPRLTPWRKVVRYLLNKVSRLLIWLFTRPNVKGLENFPKDGPLLIVTNHLGDADAILGLAFSPGEVDLLSKADLYDYPLLGRLMDAYGVIWIHRGQPDRRALRAALDGLKEGRRIVIAPEARESTTGGLEEATNGASFLSLKSGAPLLPVVFTGTENHRIYLNLKRLRRTDVTLTIGKPFHLQQAEASREEALDHGTQTIMHTLARLLPPEYRGVYKEFEQDAE